MKFAYLGYRTWAENILKNLKNSGFDIDSFTVENTEYKNPKSLDTKIVDKKDFENINLQEYRALLFYGWSWLIPEEIVKSKDCICLHPSPLPKYRGGSPLQHQIMNGETKSAVSLFKMDDGIDTGPVYYQKKFSLEGRMSNIFSRIEKVGTELTNKLLKDFEQGNAKYFPQNENEATFYKRRKQRESELTYEMIESMNSKELYNFIRALEGPYPRAYVSGKDGEKVYLELADKNFKD